MKFIEGNLLYLRPLERSDLNEQYLSWVNDPEVTKYMVTGTFPTSMEKLEEYYSHMTRSPNHVILAINDKKTGSHIGNITLNNIDWVSRIANMGIMIGNKNYWRRGYGLEATNLMVNYAFNKLNLYKVWLGVNELHTSARQMYSKAGFEGGTVLRKEIYQDGEYLDKMIMSKFR